ncbi:DUF3185 family protein [Gallaecimonas xiamenensis]|uniref:DUF3185 family protein n=1 Tax=Gallaecimonas xiamenensis 3-C-1 TaxID=745411 RepID=K2IY46_9GAMM|nr:DUF3185 family protein [Gallaecimonas xiamenensis]EKE67753.1 hypothetical protein B3C1_18091 [Gallaecimonas xiamenensis 3-C-1]
MKGKLLGLVLVVAGAGLAFWGYQESQTFNKTIAAELTGELDSRTMTLYIAGAVCMVLGLVGLLRK